jgi:hypothetical protein
VGKRKWRTDRYQGILCTRLNKVPRPSHEPDTGFSSASFSRLYADILPALDIAGKLVTSAKGDATLPSPSALPPSRTWTLTGLASLPPLPNHIASSVEQPLSSATTDDPFYPTYLRRESALDSTPLSGTLVRNAERELSFREPASAVPPWDGTRGYTELSQVGKWNAIYLGGW